MRPLLILSGRSTVCSSHDEVAAVLHAASEAGLQAYVEPDRLTVRVAPTYAESRLATAEARLAEVSRQRDDAERARGAAVQRADDLARQVRELQRRPDAPSFYDREGDGWSVAS